MNSPQPWWSTRAFAYAMIFIAAIPLLLPTIPPLVDLPGHMGRYAIQMAPPNSELHRWFEFVDLVEWTADRTPARRAAAMMRV